MLGRTSVHQRKLNCYFYQLEKKTRKAQVNKKSRMYSFILIHAWLEDKNFTLKAKALKWTEKMENNNFCPFESTKNGILMQIFNRFRKLTKECIAQMIHEFVAKKLIWSTTITKFQIAKLVAFRLLGEKLFDSNF